MQLTNKKELTDKEVEFLKENLPKLIETLEEYKDSLYDHEIEEKKETEKKIKDAKKLISKL